MFPQLTLWFAIQPKGVSNLLKAHLVGFMLCFLLALVGLGTYAPFGFVGANFSIQSLLAIPFYSFIHPINGFNAFLSGVFDILWFYWVAKNYGELYGKNKVLLRYFVFMIAAVVSHVALSNSGYLFSCMPITLGFMMVSFIHFPHTKFNLFGIFNVPYWVILAFLSLAEFFEGIAPFAIVAPLVIGFIWATIEKRGISFGANIFSKQRSTTAKKALQKAPVLQEQGRSIAYLKSGKTNPTFSSPQEELDFLLDKISEKGYANLSDTEKQRLANLSQD
jgi:hypothetical protein